MEQLNELVATLARSNSEIIYKKIFHVLFNPLKRFSYDIVKSYPLAEEIASDILLVIWEDRQNLLAIRNIKHYAFVAAKNRSLNVLKKLSKAATISIDDINVEINPYKTDPESIYMQGEMINKINRAISSLPPKCKLVFKLVREEGFSYKEAAEIIGISTKSVDAHLVSATKRLTKELRSEFSSPKNY